MELPGHSQGGKGQSCIQVQNYRQTDKSVLLQKQINKKAKCVRLWIADSLHCVNLFLHLSSILLSFYLPSISGSMHNFDIHNKVYLLKERKIVQGNTREKRWCFHSLVRHAFPSAHPRCLAAFPLETIPPTSNLTCSPAMQLTKNWPCRLGFGTISLRLKPRRQNRCWKKNILNGAVDGTWRVRVFYFGLSAIWGDGEWGCYCHAGKKSVVAMFTSYHSGYLNSRSLWCWRGVWQRFTFGKSSIYVASEDPEGRVTSFKERAEISGRAELCDTLPKDCSEGGELERNPDRYDYILTSL